MAVDKAKFTDSLIYIGKWEGSRCSDVVEAHEPEIVAAAIGASLLMQLRMMAEHKVLSQHDIQSVIDGFIEGAKVEAYDAPMGGTLFRKITPTTKATT